jgi:hypothetical protein
MFPDIIEDDNSKSEVFPISLVEMSVYSRDEALFQLVINSPALELVPLLSEYFINVEV